MRTGLTPPRLNLVSSEFRSITAPLLRAIEGAQKRHPGRPVTVIVPELVEGRWWGYLMHANRERRLRARLLRYGGPNVVVSSVPWQLQPAGPADAIAEEEPTAAAAIPQQRYTLGSSPRLCAVLCRRLSTFAASMAWTDASSLGDAPYCSYEIPAREPAPCSRAVVVATAAPKRAAAPRDHRRTFALLRPGSSSPMGATRASMRDLVLRLCRKGSGMRTKLAARHAEIAELAKTALSLTGTSQFRAVAHFVLI